MADLSLRLDVLDRRDRLGDVIQPSIRAVA
jgi:hypothetical protein